MRKVRAKSQYDSIPLVMVTSEQALAKVEEALDQAGANGYICKPFTNEEVETKLEKILARLAEAKKSPAGKGFFARLLT